MTYIYIYIIIGLKGTISLGGQKKKKDGKVGEEKVVGFSSPLYSLKGNGRQLPRVEPEE